VLVDESGVCRLAHFGLSQRIGCDSSQLTSVGEDDDDDPRERSKISGASALPDHMSLMRHGPQRHRNSSPHPATATPTHPDHPFLPGSLAHAALELLLLQAQSVEEVNGHSHRPTAHPAQHMLALDV
jgi:MAP/microtubule affinity-regulating kinase